MASRRHRVMSALSVLAGVGAVGATLAFAHDVAKKSLTAGPPPLPPAVGQPSSSAVAEPDSAGPRCDGALTAVAFAQTPGSRVAICSDSAGGYQYHGLRLADGAMLDVPAESAGDGAFVARNDGVTYTLSAHELVIAAGGEVLRREPVLNYLAPQPH